MRVNTLVSRWRSGQAETGDAPIRAHVAALTLADLDAESFARLEGCCSEAELARADRFLFAADRRSYIAAHGLVRLCLSALYPAARPRDWRFAAAPLGKPQLLSPPPGADPRFNLSHCRERVVCALVEGRECGVDVELARCDQQRTPIEACLADPERLWLESVPEDARSTLFLRLWTLKEALSKALGLGLHTPFNQICFEPEHLPRLRSAPGGDSRSGFHIFQRSICDFFEAVVLIGEPEQSFELVDIDTSSIISRKYC